MLDEASDRHTEAAVHYQEAAASWRRYGHVLELAQALAGASRTLRRADRPGDAEPLATESGGILRELAVPGWVSDALDIRSQTAPPSPHRRARE